MIPCAGCGVLGIGPRCISCSDLAPRLPVALAGYALPTWAPRLRSARLDAQPAALPHDVAVEAADAVEVALHPWRGPARSVRLDAKFYQPGITAPIDEERC